ncbi:MAG TPA: F0F1 ATP synthase subunit B [Candidatus Cryptobacteroides merdipullorum]|uniref:ATP synthase subunit b n=1 Tax=Candidatus Cryptobacteroides merdipullorum TaxID=2840771 RepID=A0A9D1KHB5_9BACT|nr:F0F1 ATP synthase subunit B [Candidatus Cryptobacteroides merdipullorum]
MSLVTPDFGLLFWMVIIFGVVFFVLAKFGFPVITGMVRKRSDHIEESLKKAQEAQEALENLTRESRRMTEEARAEQGRILKEATRTRDQIIAEARQKAQEEADKIVEHAKIQIAAERESAMRDVCRQVSLISVKVAEKIVKKELDSSEEQLALIDRLVEECSRSVLKN